MWNVFFLFCLRLAADQAEAVLKDFSPFFRRQFSVARFSQLEDDLEQNKEKITQLLKQKVRVRLSDQSEDQLAR